MIIKYNVTLLLLIFFCRFSFADTYIWEDYDDFSGSTLDTSKWGTMYLGGGIEPHVTDGKLVLSGGVGNPSASKVVKTGWTEIFKGDDGGQAWIYAKGTEVYGIEAEFIIPSAASSMSGLALGIASLNPLSYSIVELNAEPNSASQYSQGFGFYHLLNGSDIENFGTTERNITHRLGATLIHGKIKLYVNGEVRYNAEAGTFNTDMFFLNGFNDYQQQSLAFELTADNVRVLRRSTTTSLDGSTLVLSSTVGVSETLAFENGTFTSTFVDPQEGTIVKAGQSYTLDQITQDTWKITLEDGDTYSFDDSKGTGISEDFTTGNFSGDNSYELISGNLYKDLQGSGVFTFKHYEWEVYDDFSASSLDTNKWEVGYFAGGETVTVVNGQAKLSGSTYSFGSPFQMPSELSAAGQGSTEGNTFLFIKDPTIIGLEADIMIPNAGNQNEAGIYLTTLDSNPLGSLGFELRKTATGSSFNYDYFNDQGSKTLGYEAGSLDTLHKIKMTELNGQTSYYLDNKLIKQFASTSHDSDYWGIGAFNDNGLAYTTYADNVRILRQGTTTTQPEPVTVVSDPNGQAIVVQFGDEYQWKSTLDGITLWMVHEDDDDGWFGATVQYVSGIQKGSIGLTDQLGSSLEVNHPYIVDENGMIKVTEDTAFQYYQVTSVENGVIITADDSSFPLSDTSRFFTTRAAAEEYYYSKVGYPNPNSWLWFDHYPWVYSHKEQGWLYFKPSGGKLMYFSHKNNIWREFSQ
jgi:hypothetical protein